MTKTKPSGSTRYGEYADKTNNATSGENKVAVCGAASNAGSGQNSKGAVDAETLKNFVAKTLKEDGNGNWPTSTAETDGGKDDPKPKPNDNAKAVAKDLVEKLSSEEKTIVAGLLAKTIEGGEVVEIRAVSSTSVMVNACYDLLSEGLG
ncbi:Surface antigen [Anaplasma phagocytophilum]|nr:Surface antigen [Anaplasma phagocytophilum]SCV65308.1 Surface antigen [Anaplasma phagocytophilum]SCV65708.1 Surface antigen [Anaplasma phagocytophilum]